MLPQLQSNSAEVKFHTSMKISTSADLVQRLLWQRVSQGLFCQTGWVWDDSVKKQCPGWHCRISLKKWNKQAWPNIWASAKSSLAPTGCTQLKLTGCFWQWQGRGGQHGARRGEAGAALGLLSHPPPFPREPALETLVKCTQPWIIQHSCKHKPHNRPEVCLQPHSKGPEYCPEFIARCQLCKPWKYSHSRLFSCTQALFQLGCVAQRPLKVYLKIYCLFAKISRHC